MWLSSVNATCKNHSHQVVFDAQRFTSSVIIPKSSAKKWSSSPKCARSASRSSVFAGIHAPSLALRPADRGIPCRSKSAEVINTNLVRQSTLRLQSFDPPREAFRFMCFPIQCDCPSADHLPEDVGRDSSNGVKVHRHLDERDLY